MTNSTQHLRRAAKNLKRDFEAGNPSAQTRVAAILPTCTHMRHADALHVIAVEAGYDSWPKLKFEQDAQAQDRAARAASLAQALYFGRGWAVDQLLSQTPGLGKDRLSLACALYDVDEIRRRLTADPAAATRQVDGRRPIAHLAFSRFHQCGGDEAAMLSAADALVQAGADINDTIPADDGTDCQLSVLYGALGHGNNMALAEWLLDHGANPNDNESLYHATELGHRGGIRLLLAHGAQVEGTNAILRALDFDDTESVRLLLDAALPNDLAGTGDARPPKVLDLVLHHAARRMCSAETVQLLIDRGADVSAVEFSHTAYALACIYGNHAAARVIADHGDTTPLNPAEAQLVRAANDEVGEADWIDMDQLSEETRKLLCRLTPQPNALPHVKRLVAMGFDPNVPDEMGLTPLMLAGWQGLIEPLTFFLGQGPDLAHVNRYGGTLLGTILHGSENCPDRASRDHIGCMETVLRHGIALPKRAVTAAGDADMAGFLADWAQRHPGQVVAEGPF